MAANESADMSWLDPPDPPSGDGDRTGSRAARSSTEAPARVSARVAVIAAAVAAVVGVGAGMEVASGTGALGTDARATARAGCDLLRQVPEDFMDHAPDGTASSADATGPEQEFWRGRARLWAAQGLFEIASQLGEPGYAELRPQRWSIQPSEDHPAAAGLRACDEAGL